MSFRGSIRIFFIFIYWILICYQHTNAKPQLLQSTSGLDFDVNFSPHFHIINDCMMISMDEGIFHYKSMGSSTTCGLYLLAEPNKNIQITIQHLNVDCQSQGLISVVDGWELNGELFPSPRDHQKETEERFHEFCGEKPITKKFISSQNAALIQYRIPKFAGGFAVKVQHIKNLRPCNILVQDVEGVYTLENYGRGLNCSLTALFDAKIHIFSVNTGIETSHIQRKNIFQNEILHKCGKRGLEDYVEIGGSNGLDNGKMSVIEEFCGVHHENNGDYIRVFCGMSTVRLVSSGKYANKVVAEIRKAEIEDLELANYICDP